MEYTVKRLAAMAGITARTLRYYDELGILKPARISSSGYRIYGSKEVDRLQQILFYRELGVSLDEIHKIISAPTFDSIKALEDHKKKLIDKRKQLDALIENVEKTIMNTEGRIEMSDKEKFEGFKQKLIDENEQKYGKEIRKKYGEEAINESNNRFKDMSKEDFDKMAGLEKEMKEKLALAMDEGDPAGELGQKAAELHKEWITMAWGRYNKDAHAGVAQMYVDDERFTAYYDKERAGSAKFLRDAIFIYTGRK